MFNFSPRVVDETPACVSLRFTTGGKKRDEGFLIHVSSFFLLCRSEEVKKENTTEQQ